MQRLSLANLAKPLLQLPRPWMVALLAVLVLATPGQSQLRLFDRRDEELALRSELSVLTSQLGAVEQVLSELLQGSSQPDNLLNVLDQLNRQDGFVLSATITALQDRLRNAEGALSAEEMANLRLAYEEAQRRYVRVQSLRARIAQQMIEPRLSGPDAAMIGKDGGQSMGQDNAGQDNAGEDNTGQDNTGQDNAGQDNAGQDVGPAAGELARLQADTRRLASQLSRSQDQLLQAQAAAQTAQQALAKRQVEAEQLSQALRQTQSKLEDSQANAGALTQALQDLEQQRAVLANKAEESQTRLDAAQAALAEAQSQQSAQALALASVLDRAEQAETELARAQLALQTDDSQARKALVERENALADLQNTLTVLNQRLGDQQSQVETLEAQRAALQTALAERDQALVAARLAQAEIRDAVQAQVADQKAQINRLKLALSERDAELALTARALTGKQEALATTLSRIETLEGEAEGLVTTLSEREAELARALAETQGAKARERALEQALADSQRLVQGLETQISKLEAEAGGQTQQLAEAAQHLQQAQALADQRQQQLNTPRLALPEQVAWSFETRFGSLGHRLNAAQRRDLRSALASKPEGGCLLISASADPRPIKSGYSVQTNSELASLRALSLLRGLQALDKQAAEDSLILGLSEFQTLEQDPAAQRSAKLLWLPQPCSGLLQTVIPDPAS